MSRRLSSARKLLAAACILAPLCQIPAFAAAAESPEAAAKAVNALGLDLLAKGTAAGDNALLSPYSIQSALAMTFAGADGVTRSEMAAALHYGDDESSLHESFASLRRQLEEAQKASEELAARRSEEGGRQDPISLATANRVFGQTGYAFREPFLELVRDAYAAPFQPLDFAADPSGARQLINGWVEEQTRQRIRDLIPEGALDRLTRLVLVNAIYMKAPWSKPFEAFNTRPRPFFVRGGAPRDVPTMFRRDVLGYEKREGYEVVAIPYVGSEIECLILLPEKKDGLAALEASLGPDDLSAPVAGGAELLLYLPAFRIEPPVLSLGKTLISLGMPSAFDEPPGSANFDRMAPRRPDEYLYISQVLHKTFLALDEQGTEAAAATAVVIDRATAALDKPEPPKPIEVHVDRPFLFAVRHRESGACLFLGRVTDP